MSLKDELSRRLVGILNGTIVHTETTPQGFPGMTRADMGPVADECLRQMEWAFSEGAALSCYAHTEDDEKMETHGLAPPDWKP
jgi:hypothetical protein